MDNGDLIDVKDVTLEQFRDVTVESTLRAECTGWFLGPMQTTGTFEATIRPSGPERDFFSMLKSGKRKTARIKIPGETIAVECIIEKRSIKIPTNAPITQTISFKGVTV
jgi:hypothetical protein